MKLVNLGRALVAALAISVAMPAHAAIKVVATLPELACIAKAVGGDKVEVSSVARANRDYHSIEARPSDVARLRSAKLLVRTGMQFEMWMDAVANATGQRAFMAGGGSVVDASAGIKRLGVPTRRISGASGDVHVDGNPHFYYDPVYGKFIARNILRGLVRVDAKNADAYRANYKLFNAQIDARMSGWKRELAPYAGKNVVTYHENYAYFMRRFGLREYGHLEPRPGIPPSAAHLNALINSMKSDRVKAIVIESIYPTRSAALVAKQTNQSYAVAPYSPSGISADAYLNQIDGIVEAFKKALK